MVVVVLPLPEADEGWLDDALPLPDIVGSVACVEVFRYAGCVHDGCGGLF